MSNKLTSLTGFGEGDPKPERKSSINARIALNRATSGGGDEGRTPHKYGAKSSALNKKMGKKDNFKPSELATKLRGSLPGSPPSRMEQQEKLIHDSFQKNSWRTTKNRS